jgi:inner membrane protein
VATIYTHAFFGLGLGKCCTVGKPPWSFWLLVGFLPIVPDFDAFSRAAYGSLWGHRGYTHSFAFALALALVAAAPTYRYFRMRFWVLAAIFFLVTASHGVLDTFTNGGFGIPWFWPINNYRFGPWGPIVVQDIGFEFPDPRTSRSIQTELRWVWLPTTVAVVIVMMLRRLRQMLTRTTEQPKA